MGTDRNWTKLSGIKTVSLSIHLHDERERQLKKVAKQHHKDHQNLFSFHKDQLIPRENFEAAYVRDFRYNFTCESVAKNTNADNTKLTAYISCLYA